jgi:flavorubredoxin
MSELRKVTMNFYSEDIAYLEDLHGQGWSTEIREIVHRYVGWMREEERQMDDEYLDPR